MTAHCNLYVALLTTIARRALLHIFPHYIVQTAQVVLALNILEMTSLSFHDQNAGAALLLPDWENTGTSNKNDSITPPKSSHTGSKQRSKGELNLTGAYAEILMALGIITIPMLVLSLLLLCLIYHYQVKQSPSNLLGPASQTAPDSDAFLINFSATRLITVASWSSTCAPMLPTFAMTLISYPTARRILASSQRREVAKLPTPYQLSLLLGLFTGSLGSLWDWVKYRTWRRRERLVASVSGSVIGLLAVTFLG
jgi:hypothetical protein